VCCLCRPSLATRCCLFAQRGSRCTAGHMGDRPRPVMNN
jgi:hypothetical protein